MKTTEPEAGNIVSMTAQEEAAILGWLAQIEETDPAAIGEVIDLCRENDAARTYFIERSRHANQSGGN